MRQQRLQAFAIAAQGAGVEHGLWHLLGHVPGQLLDKGTEGWRADAQDQTGVGAELATALHHRGGQLLGHLRAAIGQGLGQHQHRVDARHLGKHRNRLRPRRRHVAQRTPAFERTGKAHRLNAGMLDQRLTDAATEDHVEHPGRHAGALSGADQRLGHALGGGHVAAVGLEHHRTTCRQCSSGVTTGGGECQREVAGAEHRHRADAEAVLAQVGARQWRTGRQRAVDACAIEVTTTQYLGK
ncbi:hypothetical protein D3C77_498280 [compost metagenome]